jgi:hypothetical protein
MWDSGPHGGEYEVLESSGIQRRVVTVKLTDISEVRSACITMIHSLPPSSGRWFIHRHDNGGSTHLFNISQRNYTALHPSRLWASHVPQSSELEFPRRCWFCSQIVRSTLQYNKHVLVSPCRDSSATQWPDTVIPPSYTALAVKHLLGR